MVVIMVNTGHKRYVMESCKSASKEAAENYLREEKHFTPIGNDEWTNSSGVIFSILDFVPIEPPALQHVIVGNIADERHAFGPFDNEELAKYYLAKNGYKTTGGKYYGGNKGRDSTLFEIKPVESPKDIPICVK